MANVPDTTNFSLTDVTAIVGGTSLSAAFTNSVDSYFDVTYKGSKDRLSNFRNYTVNLGCPSIGDSYGGGIVAYIFQLGDNGYVSGECHGLIVANSDIGPTFGPTWGCSGVNISTSQSLGYGMSNTINILSSCTDTSIAAKLCYDYSVTVNGITYNDWFLPSIEEINKFYINKDIIGGYTNANAYWSSSQYSSTSAMVQYYLGGYLNVSKAQTDYLRPIRYF